MFDQNQDGSISKDEIVFSFSKFGIEITEQQINEIMEIHDSNNDGTIDLIEFKKMLGYQDCKFDIPDENQARAIYPLFQF